MPKKTDAQQSLIPGDQLPVNQQYPIQPPSGLTLGECERPGAADRTEALLQLSRIWPAPASPTVPLPTVGRIVEYRMHNGARQPGEVRPAIITQVFNSETVHLMVFCTGEPDGQPHDKATFVRSAVRYSEAGHHGTWRWMAFQTGQAGRLVQQIEEIVVRLCELEANYKRLSAKIPTDDGK